MKDVLLLPMGVLAIAVIPGAIALTAIGLLALLMNGF